VSLLLTFLCVLRLISLGKVVRRFLFRWLISVLSLAFLLRFSYSLSTESSRFASPLFFLFDVQPSRMRADETNVWIASRVRFLTYFLCMFCELLLRESGDSRPPSETLKNPPRRAGPYCCVKKEINSPLDLFLFFFFLRNRPKLEILLTSPPFSSLLS